MAKDKDGKVSKDYIRLALDGLGPAAGLPPYGAIDQVLIPCASFHRLLVENNFLSILLTILVLDCFCLPKLMFV